MARIRLRVDMDLVAFENDLVAAVTRRVPAADAAAVRAAVREVLGDDMVVAEMCGRRIFCSEVEAYGPLSECDEK